MTRCMIFFAVLMLLTSIFCDSKFWRNSVNSLSDDMLERQSCPSPSSCPSSASTCSSQNCPSGQKCCIDFGADKACCLNTATTPAPTSTPTCPLGVDNASFCLASDICSGAQDCYPDELCCVIRVDNPFPPCCIKNSRPEFV